MEILGFTIPYIPSFGGFAIAVVAVILLSVFATRNGNGFAVLFGKLYEGMLEFFEDILGVEELMWIKSFVTNMFFVVLMYNLFGLLTDFIAPIFGYNTQLQEYSLAKIIGFGTSDYHFTIAMAIVGVLITLGIQLVSMKGSSMPYNSLPNKIFGSKASTPFVKLFNFFYEYVPFLGKDIITIERGDKSAAAYYPMAIIVKLFDILISMFVGLLDIIGVFAKVISLAFRLFGNMMSGTVLFGVLMLGMGAATAKLTGGMELPLIAPIILVIQGLLVACIQAFVFPLLIAIFIKVARMGDEDEQPAAA